MEFDKLTLKEEVVEKKVLSHLKQKKRRRRKRPKGKSVVEARQMNSCGESEIPAKQMKVMQGVGGSELLVFN